MAIQLVKKSEQAYGAFNGGEIVENKPIGFNREGGKLKAYSSLFYWAFAEAKVDSTIGLHPHQGFEIMSFVLNGEIRHYDDAGKTWIPLQKGDVQIICAGSGISHAEFMEKDSQMFQIWFDPGLQKTMSQPATYDDYKANVFKMENEGGYSKTNLVGNSGPIHMDAQGVKIARLVLTDLETSIPFAESEIHSIYVLKGTVNIGDQTAEQDDFLLIENEISVNFTAEERVELFMISTPAKLDYPTYKELMQSQI